jgi:hypothetical protein
VVLIKTVGLTKSKAIGEDDRGTRVTSIKMKKSGFNGSKQEVTL